SGSRVSVRRRRPADPLGDRTGQAAPPESRRGNRVIERLLGRLPRGSRALAWLGILGGIVAFWVALPPLSIRNPVAPVLIGVLAIALGIGALSRGVRRLGWGAVVIGGLGIALGYLATRSSVGHLDQVVVWSALTAAMLRYATPLAFAAMGGLFSERRGVCK